MNKFLLLIFAVALASCSVEEIEDNDSFASANATVESVGCAGPDNSKTVTRDFVNENLYTAARIERFYLNLLGKNVSREGDFNPSISEIASDYLDNPLGDFSTTYSVNNNGCEDSVNLTLTVVEFLEDNCADIAGMDQTRNITPDFVQEELYTDARIKRFFLEMLDEGVSQTGTFNPSIAQIKADYLNNGVGTYTTTYSVVDGNCHDSAELSIIIEEVCNINAGSDNSVTITTQFVEEELDTDAKIDRFFLDLVQEGVSENGNFSPSIQEIKAQYISNGPGSYTTVYTVGENNCQDSAEITVVIEEACNTNAGSDKYVTLTRDYVQKNLYTAARIKRFYLNLLDEGVNKEGSFDPTISEIASSYRENPIGEFTTTYTVTANGCSDDVQLTINVIE